MIGTSATVALLGLLAAAPSPVDVTFQHSLASSDGVLPISGGSLAWDPTRDEVFLASAGLVRVFNSVGMQVYEFGEEQGAGAIFSVVPLPQGDLIALARFESGMGLERLNFRGEPQGRVELRLPAEVGEFTPAKLRMLGDRLYLCDTGTMKVVVTDLRGNFQSWVDVAALLKVENPAEVGIRGFNVDADGNLLVTVQPLFSAYVISPLGQVMGFGSPGSTPGKFNVVGGIARNERGDIIVADILRAAVSVFDGEGHFLREFGYRGKQVQNLLGPDELAWGNGRLFVVNTGRRGVSVFTLDHKE